MSQERSSLDEKPKAVPVADDTNTPCEDEEEEGYASGLKLGLVVASLLLGMFLVATDNVSAEPAHPSDIPI